MASLAVSPLNTHSTVLLIRFRITSIYSSRLSSTDTPGSLTPDHRMRSKGCLAHSSSARSFTGILRSAPVSSPIVSSYITLFGVLIDDSPMNAAYITLTARHLLHTG